MAKKIQLTTMYAPFCDVLCLMPAFPMQVWVDACLEQWWGDELPMIRDHIAKMERYAGDDRAGGFRRVEEVRIILSCSLAGNDRTATSPAYALSDYAPRAMWLFCEGWTFNYDRYCKSMHLPPDPVLEWTLQADQLATRANQCNQLLLDLYWKTPHRHLTWEKIVAALDHDYAEFKNWCIDQDLQKKLLRQIHPSDLQAVRNTISLIQQGLAVANKRGTSWWSLT